MEYMMKASEGLPLDIFFMVPSCVPSTAFDESGCVLKAADLEPLYHSPRVLGLAEVMDYIGTIHGDEDILQKIDASKQKNRVADGHAPGLHGKEACAYILAGIGSDHECTSLEEAKEKLGLGQWIMIREGTAAKNLEALIGLFQPPYHQRAMLVTDDKHPYDLLVNGHMDDILRSAVSKGADACIAIKMATFNTADYFGLKDRGAIAPGYRADIVLLSDLTNMKVEMVMKNGVIVADCGYQIPIKEPLLEHDLKQHICRTFYSSPLLYLLIPASQK
jgi:adenine deaminase